MLAHVSGFALYTAGGQQTSQCRLSPTPLFQSLGDRVSLGTFQRAVVGAANSRQHAVLIQTGRKY